MDEERIALFLDYENLAIGARDRLEGMQFDLRPVLDALAERGRVIARKAYADWSYFDEDRRMLTRSHVELIEIPQRMGASRKNSADIKLCVDALEMAFERDYVTTFVICTGDSDFTPLVHKLRELNKRVIGVGIKESTSKLLPPACDEFLYYEALEGVDVPAERRRRGSGSGGGGRKGSGRGAQGETLAAPPPEPEPDRADDEEPPERTAPLDENQLAILIAQTVAGLELTSGGAVLASSVKRALLRKDPTFSEADHGFRAFGELLRHLAERNVIELSEGSAKGDPEVALPSQGAETEAFDLLRDVVADLRSQGSVQLSGLKNRVRKVRPDFTEKKYGYRGFLQFCRAAATQGVVTLEWDDESEDYLVSIP
ncbi:MAG: PIN domain-containing protein [Actinomycetota bacterium]